MQKFNELNSLITSTDSYKVSHWMQYPKGTHTHVHTAHKKFYIQE